jgi:hypothetical protein
MRKSIIHLMVLITLAFTSACKNPKCDVIVPNFKKQRAEWFGVEKDVESSRWSTTGWERFENYSQSKIFIDEFDLDILNCKECENIKILTNNNIKIICQNSFSTNLKTISITKNRNEADYIAHGKVAMVKQRSWFSKLTLMTPSNDTCLWWFKIINIKTGKTAFIYYNNSLVSG